MTEPPPVTAPVEVTEPVASEAIVEAPDAVDGAAPAAPATSTDDAAAAAADDPVPTGAVPGRAAATAAGPRSGTRAPAAGAQAAPASRPASSGTSARSAKAQSTGRIEIPAIGLNHLTYEGIDLPTIDKGPSHWPGTPLPGERGNTVFPGHRTTHSRPFFDMDKLKPGNEVTFTTPAGRFTYRVREIMIVGANDTWIVDDTPDATFTLMACHPKGSARQRIVAKGTLVSAPAAAPAPARPNPPPPTTTTTRQKFLGIF